MERTMGETVMAMADWVHGLVWGPGTLLLFLFVGVLYSLRLGFFQVFGFRRWWNATAGSLFKGDAHGGTISPFRSACTALAATIGTGNIAGVATALLAGGPGAVFWMWVSAVLGMATAYGETELGIRYRRRGRDGQWLSGPMLYLEQGLHLRWAGILYGVFCILASFGMGSLVQANAISETMEFAFSMPSLVCGGILSVLAGWILAGGQQKIARTAEKLVPFSALLYMGACFGVLFLCRERIFPVLSLIFGDAFSFRGAAGGAFGFWVSRSVRYGVARGVFSNEAGLGSLAVLNGGVDEAEPGVQGQWAVFEVFFDTIVSCTLTALVILCVLGEEIFRFPGNGAALTGVCFARVLGPAGGFAVSACVVLFAFSTILAWYYMGRQSAAYLGEALGRDFSSFYMGGYLAAVFLGCLGPMEGVWKVSDIFNVLMAAPNLAALGLLVREVRRPGKGKTPRS